MPQYIGFESAGMFSEKPTHIRHCVLVTRCVKSKYHGFWRPPTGVPPLRTGESENTIFASTEPGPMFGIEVSAESEQTLDVAYTDIGFY